MAKLHAHDLSRASLSVIVVALLATSIWQAILILVALAAVYLASQPAQAKPPEPTVSDDSARRTAVLHPWTQEILDAAVEDSYTTGVFRAAAAPFIAFCAVKVVLMLLLLAIYPPEAYMCSNCAYRICVALRNIAVRNKNGTHAFTFLLSMVF